MRKSLLILLPAVLALSGCARLQESRFNPFTWFGSSSPATAPVDADGNIVPLVPARTQLIDNRDMIDQVTALRINRTPDGAIVTATGVAATQGKFNAQLVPTLIENGVLTLAFRVEDAQSNVVGSVASRQITVARGFEAADLVGIRSIRVEGARNARTSSR